MDEDSAGYLLCVHTNHILSMLLLIDWWLNGQNALSFTQSKACHFNSVSISIVNVFSTKVKQKNLVTHRVKPSLTIFASYM